MACSYTFYILMVCEKSLIFIPLVPGLFSLKSAYRPEAYFGKLMYEGHLFLEMLLFCNPLRGDWGLEIEKVKNIL